ncbi:UNVERIFIED_CONTAM: hypothetical protein RMT77_007795 [Armadillidium vulgare]
MNPKSLVHRCVEVASQLNPKDLQVLPLTLKEEILLYLMKKSICTVEYLKILLHRRITKLDLTFCFIEEKDLLLLNNLTNLRYIYLPSTHGAGKYGHTRGYSEEALLRLFENKKKLEVVILRGYRHVTDEVVKIIVENSPKLQVINLDGTSISNDSLFYLKDCKYLINLSISNTEVTGRGIVHFASGDAIKNLKFLYIEDVLMDKLLEHFSGPKSNLFINGKLFILEMGRICSCCPVFSSISDYPDGYFE